MSEPLDPAEWPRWFHHVTLESVLCATPAEAEDLPEGYRREPWSEEEKYLHARAAQTSGEQQRHSAVARLAEELALPVTATPPPPPARVPYRRPSRAKAAVAARKESPRASYPPKKRGAGVKYDDC